MKSRKPRTYGQAASLENSALVLYERIRAFIFIEVSVRPLQRMVGFQRVKTYGNLAPFVRRLRDLNFERWVQTPDENFIIVPTEKSI